MEKKKHFHVYAAAFAILLTGCVHISNSEVAANLVNLIEKPIEDIILSK